MTVGRSTIEGREEKESQSKECVCVCVLMMKEREKGYNGLKLEGSGGSIRMRGTYLK